jgi:uncharacterized protein
VTDAIPLFPLGTVLFPGVVLPLHVFEPRYRTLVRDLMDRPAGPERLFGVVAIRRGTETGPHDDASLYRVGCSAELRQVKTYADGRFDIVTVGRRRFRLRRLDNASAPYLRAEIEWLPDGPGEPGLADRLAPNVLAAFRRYLRLLSEVSAADQEDATDGATASGSEPEPPEPDPGGEQLPDDPVVLSHLVAASSALTVADRQQLLAAPDTATRLRAELSILRRETRLLAALHAIPGSLPDLGEPTSPN